VHYPLRVKKVETRDELEEKGFGFGREKWFSHVVEEGLEIVFEEVHYEVDSKYAGEGGEASPGFDG
jgi:hypothetical protein